MIFKQIGFKKCWMKSGRYPETMPRLKELAPYFLRATEQAAIACGKLRGCRDKNRVDDAAVKSMRSVFDTIPVHARVAIGEGEMDKAPMLFIGEELGMGIIDPSMLQVDIAVDPLECTSHCAFNLPNSICVLAVAPRGTLLHSPECYMDKIAGSAPLTGRISLGFSVEENINSVSEILKKPIQDVKVIILDRPRNDEKINMMKQMGVNVELIQNGDIVGAMRAVDGDADLLLGIGSAPEVSSQQRQSKDLMEYLKENCIFTNQVFRNEQKNTFKMMLIKFGIRIPCVHLKTHCLSLPVCVTDGFPVFNLTVMILKHGAELFMLKQGKSKPLKQFIIKKGINK